MLRDADLGGSDVAMTSLSNFGVITNSSATTATLLNTRASVSSGAITGNLTLWVLHESLTLSGANTYTGGTEIFDAILQLGDGFSDGSIVGDIDIDSGGALFVDDNKALTLNGISPTWFPGHQFRRWSRHPGRGEHL